MKRLALLKRFIDSLVKFSQPSSPLGQKYQSCKELALVLKPFKAFVSQ